MYKFNNNSITTSYIKAKLADFNLPTFAVWKSGMNVHKGCFYLNETVVARALNSGTFEDFTTANFHIVYDNYTFGSKILNVTKSLSVSALDYDSYTHEFLGDYLRFYRDYYDINLMSMYNCFSNRTVTDLDLSWSVTERGVKTEKTFNSKDGSKIYAIPVRPGNKYTIYYDCDSDVELVAGYYYNGIIDVFAKTSYSFDYSSFYSKHSHTSFNRPFVYDKLTKMPSYSEEVDTKVYNQEENLKLFIKVPATNMVNQTPSLVVLEGDYSNYEYTFNKQDYELVPSNTIKCDENNKTIDTEEYKSVLGLTKMNTYNDYPFSNRLLEYLFENAIGPAETISNNIVKVQKAVFTKTGNWYGLEGVWDTKLKRALYNIAKDKHFVATKSDIIGYCDKDLETAIVLED